MEKSRHGAFEECFRVEGVEGVEVQRALNRGKGGGTISIRLQPEKKNVQVLGEKSQVVFFLLFDQEKEKYVDVKAVAQAM